jgi:hypothetical protein
MRATSVLFQLSAKSVSPHFTFRFWVEEKSVGKGKSHAPNTVPK